MSTGVAVWIVVALLGGMVAGIVAAQRGVRPAFGYFIIGAFIPILGVIVAAVATPAAPAGMATVVCQRCTAKQNVQAGAPVWTCWQCHAEWHLQSG